MKRLLIMSALLVSCLVTQAQFILTIPLTGGTVSNVLSTPKIIDTITVTATTTNATTIYFFDTSNTTTTIVRAAYSSYASYATNFSVIFTNQSGYLVTNSYSGIFTAPTAVSAVTNSRTAVYSFVVPAGATRTKDVKIIPLRGLAAVANNDASLEVEYRNND